MLRDAPGLHTGACLQGQSSVGMERTNCLSIAESTEQHVAFVLLRLSRKTKSRIHIINICIAFPKKDYILLRNCVVGC